MVKQPVKQKTSSSDGDERQLNSTARRLLEQATDYVRENGLLDLSLRELARAIGTSHTLLLYHFGSREKLLVAIGLEVRRRERQDLATAGAAPTPEELVTHVWRHFTSDQRDDDVRRFFYLFGLALQDPDELGAFFDDIVSSWAGPTELDDDHLRNRLILAATRGLILDLLATDERAAVDACIDLLIRMVRRDIDLS